MRPYLLNALLQVLAGHMPPWQLPSVRRSVDGAMHMWGGHHHDQHHQPPDSLTLSQLRELEANCPLQLYHHQQQGGRH